MCGRSAPDPSYACPSEVVGAMFRITPDLPKLTVPQLTHLLSRCRSIILALHNGSPECLKNIL